MIKVLVVDDSALARRLIGQTLAAEPDMQVEVARDGVEALEALRRFAPDVVTLDVHMPQMDGLACLDRIMVERPCPVVMVSSATSRGADASLEALRLGAVDFVAKPGGALSLRIGEFAPELVAKVRAAAGARLPSTLRLRERVRRRIHGAQASPSAHAPPSEGAASRGLVVIGSSTGGPPALEAVLAPLGADFPWPIVVAQHMPASFTGPLARRLDGLCEVNVVEALQPMALEAGRVHIGRGDADVVVSRRSGDLFVMAAPARPDYLWRPSVDRLVRSAMQHAPADRIVAVLLTGMGSDGAAAMTELRAAGGRTIAEAQETAVVWGMPGELVKAGGAERVLPVGAIADALEEMVAAPCR